MKLLTGAVSIHASHFAHNAASGKVLRKIGRQYEGRLRCHIAKWDQFYDLDLYGILKTELSAA